MACKGVCDRIPKMRLNYETTFLCLYCKVIPKNFIRIDARGCWRCICCNNQVRRHARHPKRRRSSLLLPRI